MGRPGQRTFTLVLEGPIDRSDLEGLVARVCAQMHRNRGCLASCDVSGVEPDVVTVEAIARLQLTARRLGCRVNLLHASPELLDLVCFMGLAHVVLEKG